MRACLDGDDRAWNELVERYASLVYSTILQTGIGEDDAAHVFLSVFATLYRRQSTLGSLERLAPWLMALAYRRAVRVRQMNAGEPFQDSPPPVQVLRRWERREMTERAIGKLDPLGRKLISALFADGSPDFDTLAAQLGIRKEQVGAYCERYLGELQAVLREMGVGTGSPPVESGTPPAGEPAPRVF